jgi:hypothetical protein
MTSTSHLVTGVDFVSVRTQNMVAAVEFYGTTLGLRRSVYMPDRHFAEFETGPPRPRDPYDGYPKAPRSWLSSAISAADATQRVAMPRRLARGPSLRPSRASLASDLGCCQRGIGSVCVRGCIASPGERRADIGRSE